MWQLGRILPKCYVYGWLKWAHLLQEAGRRSIFQTYQEKTPLARFHGRQYSQCNHYCSRRKKQSQARKPSVKAEELAEPVRDKPDPTPLVTETGRTTRRKANSDSAASAELVYASTELDLAKCMLGPAIPQSVLDKRKTADDLPPGLHLALWTALNP